MTINKSFVKDIQPTPETIELLSDHDELSHSWGDEKILLDDQQITHLLSGGTLRIHINRGEYTLLLKILDRTLIIDKVL